MTGLYHLHVRPDRALVEAVLDDDVPGALEGDLDFHRGYVQVLGGGLVRFAGLVFVKVDGVEKPDIGLGGEDYLDEVLRFDFTFIMKVIHRCSRKMAALSSGRTLFVNERVFVFHCFSTIAGALTRFLG